MSKLIGHEVGEGSILGRGGDICLYLHVLTGSWVSRSLLFNRPVCLVFFSRSKAVLYTL
jgi:hypothetical protein